MRNYRVIAFILGLGLIAIPASATITYTSCTSGCTDNSGTYAALPTEPGASGLTFSSPFTFSTGLSGSPATYAELTTGTTFNGFNGNTQDSLTVTGSNLVQTIGGTGTSIQIVLPAATYAVAFVVGTNAFLQPWIELVNTTSDLNTGANAQYQSVIPGSSSPQFVALVSDSPITSVFIWDGGGSGVLNLQSFEIGTSAGDTGTGGNGDVPEPSTLFTLGGGVVGLFFWHRHRRLA
jgi:PEP-CTERM motif